MNLQRCVLFEHDEKRDCTSFIQLFRSLLTVCVDGTSAHFEYDIPLSYFSMNELKLYRLRCVEWFNTKEVCITQG